MKVNPAIRADTVETLLACSVTKVNLAIKAVNNPNCLSLLAVCC